MTNYSFKETWLEEHLKIPGHTFLDIGFNVGEWSRYLSPHYKQIIGFEPNNEIKKEIEFNLPKNITVIYTALWNENTKIKLTTFKDSVHSSIIFNNEYNINAGPAVDEFEIYAQKLDDFSFGNIDFIKIDVEGAEVGVIKGGLNTIKKHKPIMIIENHSKENREWIEENIPKIGYDLEIIYHPAHGINHRLREIHLWIKAIPKGDKR